MTTLEKLPRHSPVSAQNAQAAVWKAAAASGLEVDMMASMRRGPWALLFLAAAALYALCRGAYFVGYFNDDAFYLIGARSLSDGAFLELNRPGAPPLVQYLPGWPLLLVPAAALGSVAAAQATAGLAMLAAAAAAAWCFRADLDAEGRLLLAALLLFNPLALSLSGAVLADAPFTALALVVLGAARRLWERRDAAVWFALGAAAGASFLVRPVGLALPAALALALLWEGRPREAAAALAGAAGAALPWLARNLAARGHPLLYFSELASGSGSGPDASRALSNGAHYATELYGRTLLRWPFPAGLPAASAAAGLAGLASAALWMRRAGLGGGRRAALLTAGLLGAALLVWEKRSGRYLLPLAPFAAAWALAGLRTGPRRALVAAALLSYAPPAWRIASASRRPTAAPALGPERTWAWVRERTPADAVFAAELDGRLFLATGRRTLTPPRAGAAEGLADWARASGVDYLLVEPTGDVMRTAGGRSAHDAVPAAERAATAERSAPLVFTDEAEGTRVYRMR